MRKTALIVLLVGFVLTLLVFAQGITTGHIGLDDWGYTSGCPFVRGGLTARNVSRAFTDFGYGAIWMPVTFMSYMLDVTLFGDSWRAYHAVNVGLHLANFLLVFLFLRSLLSHLDLKDSSFAPVACALAALLWAVHPQRAEAVTFVAARKEELWTLFALLDALAFGVFLSRRSVGKYLLLLALFVLSVLSKPTAMCVPFLLLAVAFLRRRLDRQTLLALVPLFLLAFGVGALTLYSQAHPTNAVSVDVFEASVPWRILNAAVSLGLYGWYALVPLGIHMDYRAVFNGWPVDGLLGLASLAVLLGAAVAVFLKSAKEGRRVLAGAAALFLFSIGPTLGLLGYVNGDQSMADRYAYFPHMALALLVAYGLAKLEGVRARRAACGAALAFAALAAALAVPVVRSYESGFTACSRALAKDPDNWRALRIVGNEYCARLNRMEDGVAMLRRSLALHASQLTADSLAYVLAIRGAEGDFDEVKRLGAAAMRRPQADEGGMMLDALGIVFLREGNDRLAAHFFSHALKAAKRNHSPDWSQLYLGLSLANAGKRGEAVLILGRLRRSRVPAVSRRAESTLKVLSSGRPERFGWE